MVLVRIERELHIQVTHPENLTGLHAVERDYHHLKVFRLSFINKKVEFPENPKRL